MRSSREAAEKNRTKVVSTAARQFRKHGYDGIGIAGLMKAAGMTQGGFYKQFKNKESLECEATELALRENFESWTKAIDDKEDPIASLKNWYLTAEHLQAVDLGCAYATLAAEATRDRPALQAVFTEAINRQIENLALALDDDENGRERAIQAMAQIVGSLILARSVDEAELQEEIISAGNA